MTCGVYKITNTKNGRFYIGSSVDIEKREKEHMKMLEGGRHHNEHMQRDHDAGGEFCCQVLQVCNEDEVRETEQTYITTNLHHLTIYNIATKVSGAPVKCADNGADSDPDDNDNERDCETACWKTQFNVELYGVSAVRLMLYRKFLTEHFSMNKDKEFSAKEAAEVIINDELARLYPKK